MFDLASLQPCKHVLFAVVYNRNTLCAQRCTCTITKENVSIEDVRSDRASGYALLNHRAHIGHASGSHRVQLEAKLGMLFSPPPKKKTKRKGSKRRGECYEWIRFSIGSQAVHKWLRLRTCGITFERKPFLSSDFCNRAFGCKITVQALQVPSLFNRIGKWHDDSLTWKRHHVIIDPASE